MYGATSFSPRFLSLLSTSYPSQKIGYGRDFRQVVMISGSPLLGLPKYIITWDKLGVVLLREENRSTQRKTPGVRLRWTISAQVWNPGVEVEMKAVSDDVTPPN